MTNLPTIGEKLFDFEVESLRISLTESIVDPWVDELVPTSESKGPTCGIHRIISSEFVGELQPKPPSKGLVDNVFHPSFIGLRPLCGDIPQYIVI
jgi:hypothetical protein